MVGMHRYQDRSDTAESLPIRRCDVMSRQRQQQEDREDGQCPRIGESLLLTRMTNVEQTGNDVLP